MKPSTMSISLQYTLFRVRIRLERTPIYAVQCALHSESSFTMRHCYSSCWFGILYSQKLLLYLIVCVVNAFVSDFKHVRGKSHSLDIAITQPNLFHARRPQNESLGNARYVTTLTKPSTKMLKYHCEYP